MPIIGQINPPRGHKCKPDYNHYPEGTAFRCERCQRLWLLGQDERGQLRWMKPTWWQRGKIKRLIAEKKKTVAGGYSSGNEEMVIPNVSGSTHLSLSPQRPFVGQPPSYRLTAAERRAVIRGR